MTETPTKLLLLAALITMASCVGTDVGNPPGDDDRIVSRLEFDTYTESADPSEDDLQTDERGNNSARMGNVPNGLVVANGNDLDEVWLSVASVKVLLGPDCEAAQERIVEGPFFVDLGRGVVYPEAPVLGERRESYCGLHLRLSGSKELATGAPVELTGQSVWLSGVTAAGESIELTSGNSVELSYKGDSFEVDDDAVFIAAFQRDDWLEGIDPGQPANINDNTNASDVAAFINQLRVDSRVVRDANDDRRANPDELRGPVGVPQVP